MEYTPPRAWVEVPGAVRAGLVKPFYKKADGIPGLTHLADVAGWRPGEINETWGGPRVLANLLIGSALGSLGGYGVGRLAEEFLPEEYFTPGEMRKRTAILGGALGALPAAWQTYDVLRQSDGDIGTLTQPYPFKEAAADDMFDPIIPRDHFNAMVMGDFQTPMKLRAATAGLVEAASAVRGTELVSPFDVARIAVGAGSGLVSGLIAGKALGLLAGLTPHAQKQMQQAGMWSGVIRNVVPQALGLPYGY